MLVSAVKLKARRRTPCFQLWVVCSSVCFPRSAMHPLLVLQRAASGVPDPADDGKTRWNDDEARTHPSITAIAPLDNPNVPLCPHLPASTADRGSSSSTETVTVPEVDSSPPMLSAMAAGDSTAASSTTASPITASSLCDDALPGSEQLPLPAHIFEEALKHIQSASLDISNSIASSPQTPTTPPPLNHVSVTDFLLAGSPSSLSDLQQHLDPLTISNPKESLSIFPPSTTTITEVEEIQQSPPTVSPTASPLSINASTIIYHQLAPPGKNDQTKHEYSRPPCVRCKKSKIHCTYLPGTTKCLNCKQGKRCCLPSGTPYTRLPPPDPNTTTNADDETTPRLMAVMTSDQLSPYLSDASTLVMTSPPQQLANPSLAYNQIYHPPSQPPPQQSQPRPPHSHSHSHHQVAHPQHQPQQQQQQQQQQFEEDPEVQRMINEQYFPPTLIVRGIVSPEEVQQLFSMWVYPNHYPCLTITFDMN
ncbi:uncharacterized protein EI90DRAFT_106857 [Cantharellus anzutake]|uniref:uncharacterized protein n=1 Tax=Cantharellus anzutake TaxID=1750568 RepID=UPI00190343F9|nr:uncharacterized protein EI90DRAFT_106857 [Cantharellus anzutake]KAF8337050.1 hypothetical protein EI90DRAFT_106857 [Cantharellus anzutake]